MPADESRISAIEGSLIEDSILCLPDLKEVNESQLEDADMAAMIAYLQDGTLPDEEKSSRRIILEGKQFDVVDGILYHENPTLPGRWCIVAPKKFRSTLLEEAHRGRFAGHLAGKKVYDRQRRHVWWRGMKNDAHAFCKACLVCASQKGSRKTFKPPLSPIPVGGPFH